MEKDAATCPPSKSLLENGNEPAKPLIIHNTSLVHIPQWIEIKILYMLDFLNLLTARLVCTRWNEILQSVIGSIAILNIQMDSSPSSKSFRRGKLNPNLICSYTEVRLIPKPANAFFRGRSKSRRSSTLQHFLCVKKFTLLLNGSLLHFLHRYMIEVPSIRYLQIRQQKLRDEESCRSSKYIDVSHVLTIALGHRRPWLTAIDNLTKVETLRIRLFDRTASLIYIQLFTFKMTMLAHLELDFSKCYGVSFCRSHLNEVYLTLVEILKFSYLTLKTLRLKWAVRVDNDLDFLRNDDIEPFYEFLLSLRNPVWFKLRLHMITLSFPILNMGLSLCETTLFRWMIYQQPYLRRAVFTRVLPNEGVDDFATRFQPAALAKFEFFFHFTEASLMPQPVNSTRGVEVLLLEEPFVDFDALGTLNQARRGRGNAMSSCTLFRLIHSHNNTSYPKPDLSYIVCNFQNVRVVELLDTSVYGKLFMHFTSEDFNLLLDGLPRLISFKMSNASELTDAGLTSIPRGRLEHMKQIGVYYWPKPLRTPVIQAQELKYLDFRDLSADVPDASVYFAFQRMNKLEKISFHGSHNVTEWRRQCLEAKFRRNSYFDVIFKS